MANLECLGTESVSLLLLAPYSVSPETEDDVGPSLIPPTYISLTKVNAVITDSD